MNPRTYLTTLTPLRGIAALVVVIFHCNLMLMSFMPINEANLITMGWLWVDFFFVLSLFIISYVYGDKFRGAITARNYWTYIKARFARVYPLHFLTLIFCLICAIFITAYGDSFHPFFWDFYNPATAIPSLFLVQSLGLYITAPLNSPAWSLSREWWMYMIFPLLVPLFARVKKYSLIPVVLVIAALFAWVKYDLGPGNLPFPGGSPSLNVVADFGFFRCLAGFLLGMVLFHIYDQSLGYAFFRRSWVFVVFFAAALTAMQTGAEDILVIAIFPFVILAAAYNTTGIKQVLDTSVLQRLGDWSFSIYMVHVPIMYLYWIYETVQNPSRWAVFPPNQPQDYTQGLLMCLIVVALTLIVASLTYKYVEVPARNYLNRKWYDRRTEPVEVARS